MMFSFIRQILFLFAFIVTSMASAQPVVLTESDVLQQRLNAIAGECASLTKLVKLSLLSNAEKTSYLRFLHGCATKQKQLAQGADSQDRLLGLMEQFFEYMKSAHLKLELMTIGRDTSSHAVLEKSLDQKRYHQLLATIHLKIYSWFDIAWMLACHAASEAYDELTNDDITHIVYNELPVDLCADANSLQNVLAVNLFEEHPLLADEYRVCMEQCQNFKYAYDTKTYGALVCRLDDLIIAFEERATECLNVLISKLLCAKQEIVFSQQLQDVNSQHPTLISTFMKHHRLVQSNAFSSTYKTLSCVDRQHFDGYITLVEHFFTTAPFQSLFFINDVEAMIADLVSIINKMTAPKSWKAEFLDFMKKNQGRLMNLLDQVEVVLGRKKTAPEKTVYSEKNIIEEMLTVLSSIHDHLTQKPEESGSTWATIVAYIQSGKWFAGNVVQNEEGNIALDFADKVLDCTKFTDAKSAAKQALMYASPFLLAKIIEYLRPRLCKSVETKINALIDSKEDHGSDKINKIIDFAKNNPEVLKQLTNDHPEILDLLAQSLKELARKNG